MKSRRRALLSLLLAAGATQAHLIDAQTGTLNIVGGGAYLVLSLPVSALKGADDDGDGRLSPAELSAHVREVRAQVQAGVTLLDGRTALPLQGLMLSLSTEHGAEGSPAAQLVVMGRFGLARPDAPLRLRVSLFGRAPSERRLDLGVTRKPEAVRLQFAPGRTTQAIFARAARPAPAPAPAVALSQAVGR
jgi:hypothetical protein